MAISGDAWANIGGTLAGVIVGGGFAYWTASRQWKAQVEEQKRQHEEQLAERRASEDRMLLLHLEAVQIAQNPTALREALSEFRAFLRNYPQTLDRCNEAYSLFRRHLGVESTVTWNAGMFEEIRQTAGRAIAEIKGRS